MALGTTAAILGAAAIGTAGSIGAGVLQSKAAGNAADAQERAAMASVDLQRDTAQQARIDALPWAQAGAMSLYKYMDELGIQRPKKPLFPSLTNGPLGEGRKNIPDNYVDANYNRENYTKNRPYQGTRGYQFQVQEGEKAITNNLAALGMKNSGAALKRLTNYRQGVADQDYQGHLNRLASMAGVGQTQTNQTNNLLANSAVNQSQSLQNAGAARASGYVGAGNAWGNAISGVSNNVGNALGALAYQPNRGLI